MSSLRAVKRRSVMSWGWTRAISSIFSTAVMKTAQVSPSRSPRVTRRIVVLPRIRAILTAGPDADQPGGDGESGPRKSNTPGASSAPGVLGGSVGRALDLHDVCGAGSLRAVDDFEPHFVTLVESPESLGPDLRVVYEDV